MIDKRFDEMYFYWLVGSGYMPVEKPAFIVHRDDRFFARLFRKTRIDICLPVKPQ